VDVVNFNNNSRIRLSCDIIIADSLKYNTGIMLDQYLVFKNIKVQKKKHLFQNEKTPVTFLVIIIHGFDW